MDIFVTTIRWKNTKPDLPNPGVMACVGCLGITWTEGVAGHSIFNIHHYERKLTSYC